MKRVSEELGFKVRLDAQAGDCWSSFDCELNQMTRAPQRMTNL